MPLDPNDAPAGYVAITNEAEDCQGCALAPIFSPACERTEGLCLSIVREDGQDVIFVKRPEAQAAPAAVAEPMNAHRAAWFLERFKHEEKMLGPNEQRALCFAIETLDALAAAPAAAQPVAEPTLYVEVRECPDCGHIGVNDDNDDSACAHCDWSGPSPAEDHCPGCGRDGTMTTACPRCGHRTTLLAEAHLPVPAQHAAQPVAQEATPPALVGLSDEQIDAGAKKLAALFDYPWEHMPAKGRENMRANVQEVLAAVGMTLREGGNG